MNTTIHHEGCFGELLRREREQRGVTLDSISESTKVTVRNLRALENERFDQLPGGILGKGIVRGYVRCLGLDENEWLRLFLEAHHEPESSPAEPGLTSFALNISNNRTPAEHSLHMRWTGVGVLLVLLVSFGWFVWSYLHARTTASMQNSAPKSSYASNVGLSSMPASSAPAQPVR
ncbi:MAG TPA: helix-turn-helix domain-containing protein [Acidobacteriaceae bacterium]|nr:helix-turn-helix domain-containing protein [Acidobacteriaceae bacterium]